MIESAGLFPQDTRISQSGRRCAADCLGAIQWLDSVNDGDYLRKWAKDAKRRYSHFF